MRERSEGRAAAGSHVVVSGRWPACIGARQAAEGKSQRWQEGEWRAGGGRHRALAARRPCQP